MKHFIFIFAALALIGCGSNSGGGGGNNGTPVQKGSDEQCAGLFAEVDYFDQNGDNMSKSEQMAYCRRVQKEYMGIKCERTYSCGESCVETEEIVVDNNFCSGQGIRSTSRK